MARNIVLPMVMIAGAGALIYTGITNPEGGAFAGLTRVLRGEAPVKAGTDPARAASFLSGIFPAVSSTLSTAAASGMVPATAERARVIAFARAQLGDPYRWGGNGPDAWDCSGLTVAAFAQVGVKLPRVSAAQQTRGARPATPQAGDLVFFGFPAHHVGIVTGPGTMIHAPHTGAVVREASIASEATGSIVSYRDVLSGTPTRRKRRKAKR